MGLGRKKQSTQKGLIRQERPSPAERWLKKSERKGPTERQPQHTITICSQGLCPLLSNQCAEAACYFWGAVPLLQGLMEWGRVPCCGCKLFSKTLGKIPADPDWSRLRASIANPTGLTVLQVMRQPGVKSESNTDWCTKQGMLSEILITPYCRAFQHFQLNNNIKDSNQ